MARSAPCVSPSRPESVSAGSASVVMSFVAGVQASTLASLALADKPSAFAILLGSLAVAAVTAYGVSRGSVSRASRHVACAGALVLFCTVVATLVHDFSHDGQQYHQQAIIALWSGWNPLGATEFAGPYALWINGYAKGTWLYAAGMAAVLGNVEAGKGLNLLLAIVSGMVCHDTLRERLNLPGRWATLASIVLALNPVVGTQWPTYYNDGAIGSLQLIFLAAATRLAVAPDRDRQSLLLLGLATFLMCGVKSSGAAYALLGGGAMLAILFVLHGSRGTKGPLLGLTLGAGLAMATVCANPYITNTIRHGHPLYPLYGGERPVDIISGNASPEFLAQSRLEKLALSTFSRSLSTVASEQQNAADQVSLKLPGSIHGSELALFFSRTDVRIGGFGPWFSLVVVASLAVAFIWSASRRPSPAEVARVLAAPTVLLTLTLAFPEPWWARYVPQFWAFPLALAIGCRIVASGVHAVRVAFGITIAVALLNAVLVAGLFATRTMARELDLRTQLASLRAINRQSGPVLVTFGSTPSTETRLRQAGIAFRPAQAGAACAYKATVHYSSAELCLTREQLPLYREKSALVEDIKQAIGR